MKNLERKLSSEGHPGLSSTIVLIFNSPVSTKLGSNTKHDEDWEREEEELDGTRIGVLQQVLHGGLAMIIEYDEAKMTQYRQ